MGLGLGGGVETPLELAEDDAEEEVAEGGLDEGAAVAAEGREVAAGGVEAVGEGDEGPAGEVLGDGEDGPPERRRDREAGGDVGVDGAEQRAVLDVEDESEAVPAGAVADGSAEELDVVVAAGEEELVERLRERPDAGGEGAAEGAAERTDGDAVGGQGVPNCNGRRRGG